MKNPEYTGVRIRKEMIWLIDCFLIEAKLGSQMALSYIWRLFSYIGGYRPVCRLYISDSRPPGWSGCQPNGIFPANQNLFKVDVFIEQSGYSPKGFANIFSIQTLTPVDNRCWNWITEVKTEALLWPSLVSNGFSNLDEYKLSKLQPGKQPFFVGWVPSVSLSPQPTTLRVISLKGLKGLHFVLQWLNIKLKKSVGPCLYSSLKHKGLAMTNQVI